MMWMQVATHEPINPLIHPVASKKDTNPVTSHPMDSHPDHAAISFPSTTTIDKNEIKMVSHGKKPERQKWFSLDEIKHLTNFIKNPPMKKHMSIMIRSPKCIMKNLQTLNSIKRVSKEKSKK